METEANVAAPGARPEIAKQIARIPDRLVFRIGDVSRLAQVKPHVIRYWETEFPSIAPKKGGTGQRVYRRKDVELILTIRDLLYEKRFTIEGAKKWLQEQAALSRTKLQNDCRSSGIAGPPNGPDILEIRRELESILTLLG